MQRKRRQGGGEAAEERESFRFRQVQSIPFTLKINPILTDIRHRIKLVPRRINPIGISTSEV